jgi:hypothetical protein
MIAAAAKTNDAFENVWDRCLFAVTSNSLSCKPARELSFPQAQQRVLEVMKFGGATSATITIDKLEPEQVPHKPQ